jgi:hypothetical protein
MSDDSDSPRQKPDRTAVYSLFVALLIFIIGSITYSIYQIMDSEDQLADLTRAINQLDSQVKRAQYEREKLHGLATDLLHLAPTDANAAKIVADYKIRLTPTERTAMDTGAAPASEPSSAAR